MIKLQNSTLGFTDTKTPMQKARTEDTLNKLWRYDENVISEKEFVLTKLLKGYKLEKVENYTYYKKDGELSKPKTVYELHNPESKTYNEISKTAYDFLNYVIDNNLDSENEINNYIENENAKNEQLEKERLENEKKEKERKEQEKLKQEEDRKKAHDKKVKVWNEKIDTLLSNGQKQEIENIIYKVVNQFAPDSNEDEIKRYIEKSDYITSLGNEDFTIYNANYTFIEANKDIFGYNMVRSIEKAIYIHLFNINDADTKLNIKDKLKAFYTQTEVKKRYYQGTI